MAAARATPRCIWHCTSGRECVMAGFALLCVMADGHVARSCVELLDRCGIEISGKRAVVSEPARYSSPTCTSSRPASQRRFLAQKRAVLGVHVGVDPASCVCSGCGAH